MFWRGWVFGQRVDGGVPTAAAEGYAYLCFWVGGMVSLAGVLRLAGGLCDATDFANL